jgi:hypothetical protein
MLNAVGRIINFHLRIKNPLADVSPEQLRIDVERFAKEHQLTEMTPLLMKGAFVAKDPPAFESVEGITEDEKTAIRNEVLHKWRQPKSLFFTIILCSIGAAVQSVSQHLPLIPHVLTRDKGLGSNWIQWSQFVLPSGFQH